jgi:tRNA nucleotidyltransferase (CCA-adding enzyme)
MTDSVEDFTKRGLDDLKNGVIRTPLKPYSTFFDDPLRILRTFRFASRFGFKVEPDIIEALKSEEILVKKY